MEKLLNIVFKDNVKFTKFTKTKASFILISEDESTQIKISHFLNCFIQCSECGKLVPIKKLVHRHLIKPYLCKSCNHKGNKNPMFGFKYSEEQKQKMSEERSGKNNPFYGRKHTLETKQKISKANKGKLTGENNPMFGVNVYEKILLEQGEQYLNEIKKRISKSCSGEKNGFYGHKHSLETREHLSNVMKTSEIIKATRENEENRKKLSESLKNSKKLKASRSSIEYRNKKRLQYAKCVELGTKPKCCFNPKACAIFDVISAKEGIKIQHAMNGGEFMVPNLGFFVDGYDAENNIVYEYDEKYHFSGGKLRQKDVERQKLIEEELKCKFIRLKDEDYKNFQYKTS